MKRPILFAMAAAAVALTSYFAADASAQRAGGGGMAACRTDIATFCQGLEAGGGRRMQCLTENRAKLTPECGATVDARAAGRSAQSNVGAPQTPPPTAPVTDQPPARDVTGATPADARGGRRMAACRSDIATLCSQVAAGKGGRIACLRDNQAKLSPACSATLADLKSARQSQRGACRDDAQRLCADQKGPMRRTCLQQNEAKLSPVCAAALADRATKAR